jgi:hypothetical protein
MSTSSPASPHGNAAPRQRRRHGARRRAGYAAPVTAEWLQALGASVRPPGGPGADDGAGLRARLRRGAAATRADCADGAPAGAHADRTDGSAAGLAQPPPGPFVHPRMLVLGADPEGALALAAESSPPVQSSALDTPGPAAAAQAVDGLVDSGCDLLLLAGADRDDELAAAALVSVLCRVEPAALMSYGRPRDDARWMEDLSELRDARRRASLRTRLAAHAVPGPPTAGFAADAAEALGRPVLAAAAAVVLQAAARRTPVLLDGAVALAGALVAADIAAGAAGWCLAASTGDPLEEPAHRRLGLAPALTLPGGGPSGAVALLQLQLLDMALRTGAMDGLDGRRSAAAAGG